MAGQPKSKGTWGREDPKQAEELNRLCSEFFEKLEVPKEWKDMGWNNVIDLPLAPSQGGGTSAEQRDKHSGVLLSVGKLFRDMRTRGIDLMEYRVFFLTYSTRGGICEKSIIDFGKYEKKTVVSNKTVEKLNEWIKEKYTSPPTPLPEERGDGKDQVYDKDDGLQHFRDRFGTGVATQ